MPLPAGTRTTHWLGSVMCLIAFTTPGRKRASALPSQRLCSVCTLAAVEADHEETRFGSRHHQEGGPPVHNRLLSRGGVLRGDTFQCKSSQTMKKRIASPISPPLWKQIVKSARIGRKTVRLSSLKKC